MSNPVLSPSGVTQRYQTHHSKLMTLWVTHQGQTFVTSGDLQLSDIELLSASVELVGEPGIGNVGNVSSATKPHRTTMNQIHSVNNAGVTSTVFGLELENRIEQKGVMNHGFINLEIEGMTQRHQFRTDNSQPGNDLQLLIPTDLGLSQNRIVEWPPTPILLENIELQQQIRVNCFFAGTYPANKRIARFVKDWADSPQVTTITRNSSGNVRYFINNDEGQGSSQQCQVPANCIECIKLVFRVIPRTVL